MLGLTLRNGLHSATRSSYTRTSILATKRALSSTIMTTQSIEPSPQAPPPVKISEVLATGGNPLPLFIPPPEDPLLNLLAAEFMKHGKRPRAARIVTDTLSYLHSITLVPALPLLREAVTLASPSVKVVTFRKPSKNVFMPIAIGEKQKTKLALKWMIKASEKRPHLAVEQRLAHEILSILKGDSEVLRKKEEMHKMAVVNRSNIRHSR